MEINPQSLLLIILFYLLPLLPSAVSTVVFAVWLPARADKFKTRRWGAALIALAVFILSLALIASTIFPLVNFDDTGWMLIFLFFFLLVSPLMVGAAALLYYGGKAIRSQLTRTRVVFGFVRVGLGFILVGLALLLNIYLEAVALAGV